VRHQTFRRGDVKAGFAAADHTGHEYRSATVHQGYIRRTPRPRYWSTDTTSRLGTTDARFPCGRVCTGSGILSKLKVIPTETVLWREIPAYGELWPPVARKARPLSKSSWIEPRFPATGPGSYVQLKMGEGRAQRRPSDVGLGRARSGSIVGAGGLCLLAPYNIEIL
jgi:hypothetical protein